MADYDFRAVCRRDRASPAPGDTACPLRRAGEPRRHREHYRHRGLSSAAATTGPAEDGGTACSGDTANPAMRNPEGARFLRLLLGDVMTHAQSDDASGGLGHEAAPLPRVAVLGIGIMGGAMARNLLRAGLAVDVWDRSPEAAARLTGAGAIAHASADQAVARADVAITML